jgi:hypothetical protein
MLSLDFKIFGNGYGLGAPYHAQTFYWLPYFQEVGGERLGDFYTFVGGFGAQLTSRQWFHPTPGERRLIKGRWYSPFQSHRRWLRVEVSWATKLPEGINEANAEIRKIKNELTSVLVQ